MGDHMTSDTGSRAVGAKGRVGGTVSGAQGNLVVDLRGLSPALRRPLAFSLLDKMMEMDCTDSLVLVFDHEPAGLSYQIELRKETRGRFDFHYDQRLDGAWVALLRPRC